MSRFVEAAGHKIKVDGALVRMGRVYGEKYCFLEEAEPVIAALRRARPRVDLFTFVQKLPSPAAAEPRPRYSFAMEWDNFAALPIASFEEWWTKTLGFKGRNKAKQAEKHGVVLREMEFGEDVVRGIWEIYNETPVRQGKPFSHYGMSLDQVRDYAGTFLDQSVFLGAFLEERMIGFVKMTWNETRTQAGLMHIVSLISERDKAPTNALVAHAVRACAERGIPWLVYSNFSYGNKQSDGLSDFKERNGFQKIDVPRYYVPLTPLGDAAYRLKLHHGVLHRLPEGWIARLRELRSQWYMRRLPAAGRAV